MSIQFVTVGHILSETIVYADGRREGPVLGSPSAYAATVAARLGVSAGIVTRIASNTPAALLQPLRDAGVDLAGVDAAGAVTTTNQLLYSAEGGKQLKYLKQAAPITFRDIPQSYRQAAIFHIGSLDYEVSTETIRRIAALGGIVGVDLGGYGGAHVCRETIGRKRLSSASLQELIGSCTVVKASDEDARLIFAEEDLNESQSARRFVAWGARIGIVTLGARGSFVFTRDQWYEVPALNGPAKVIDVTGAGDSFLAAFLVELMKSGDPWKAALFGAAVARYVIERTGGVLAARMPREEEARCLIPAGMSPVLVEERTHGAG